MFYTLAIYIYNKQQQNSSFIKNVEDIKIDFFVASRPDDTFFFFCCNFFDEKLEQFFVVSSLFGF